MNLYDSDTAKVLCSGIDTLFLTLDIYWKDDLFFQRLGQAKAQASLTGEKVPIELKSWDDNSVMFFDVMPSGKRGYEWALSNGEYSLSIGEWLEPISRPSAVIEIRSETLHSQGPIEAVKIIITALAYVNAIIKIIKISRVDLYCDILLPENCWSEYLKEYITTRAVKRSWHDQGKVFSGLSIGKGGILARLYDKPLEIKQKSNKTWMFAIWGIEKVPDDHNIIRVEFQLRREKIKSLEINTFDDLLKLESNLWAYCTQQWLKLQDQPGEHHTQRHTFKWWEVVQQGYKGIQKAVPLVSIKATNADNEQLLRQCIGNITSLITNKCCGRIPSMETISKWSGWLMLKFPEASNFGASPDDLLTKIKKKMAKYGRSSIAYSGMIKKL